MIVNVLKIMKHVELNSVVFVKIVQNVNFKEKIFFFFLLIELFVII